ncbi:MAG: GTPase ObgE/CgtA [Microgenomates bacterium OLB22]|nr:MAG: GTPase ObgE/CgtA [Microgenomates bacterium OLB22]
MVIDELELQIKAGDGGPGRVSFRREKYVPRGGPDGGNGGDGGSVYVKAVSDLGALSRYRHHPEILGESGEPGGVRLKTGKDGQDVTFVVPVGSILTDIESGETWDLDVPDKTILLAQGGKGGKGNTEFKSSTRQTPDYAQKGTTGQKRIIRVDLQYIAQIGLIGLPNAGKSTLLNVLTNAQVKAAGYPFTTLEPNLGDLHGVIVADIPGLIEGAHEGKGLGIRFLKHIRRTRLLVHCIDCTTRDPVRDYVTIRSELAHFDSDLLEKPEIILLTKTDEVEAKEVEKIAKLFTKKRHIVYNYSALDDESVQELTKQLLNYAGKAIS